MPSDHPKKRTRNKYEGAVKPWAVPGIAVHPPAAFGGAPFGRGAKRAGRKKPPLCKGRWRGAAPILCLPCVKGGGAAGAVPEGLACSRRADRVFAQSPTAFGGAPAHKGAKRAQHQKRPSVLSDPWPAAVLWARRPVIFHMPKGFRRHTCSGNRDRHNIAHQCRARRKIRRPAAGGRVFCRSAPVPPGQAPAHRPGWRR